MTKGGDRAQPFSTRALVINALLVSLSAAVGQGFARFGYALLLTPMRDSLGWSYAQAGLVNSANALGYLAGSLAVGHAVARWRAPRVLRLSLLAVSGSLVITGLVDHFGLLLLARFVAGAGAGLMFIAGVSAVLALDSSERSDLPIGVYYAGPGIGIALSGLLIPVVLGPLAWDWRTAWVVLGGLGLLAAALVELPLRAASRAVPAHASVRGEGLFVPGDYRRLWPALVAYTLFGLGYIGYMTFVVAFLRSIDVEARLVQGFWILLGLCAAGSGFTWRPLIRRLAPNHALAAVLAVLAAGALLPVLLPYGWSLVLSAAMFGSSFVAVVTVITIQVRTVLPRTRWTAVIGNATALFALGQLAGPTITGMIADLRGGLKLGLLGSAVTLATGAAIARYRSPGE